MWKELTIDDLQVILSQDEVDALNTLSSDPSKTPVVQDMIDMAADIFRGPFISKSFEIDTREHYIPSNYAHFVLVYARYSMWTRFPMSPAIALDDARKDEYEFIRDMIKNPTIGVDKPDWEHSNKNPENPDNAGQQQGGSIGIPFLRMDESLYDGWYNGSTLTTKAYCR